MVWAWLCYCLFLQCLRRSWSNKWLICNFNCNLEGMYEKKIKTTNSVTWNSVKKFHLCRRHCLRYYCSGKVWKRRWISFGSIRNLYIVASWLTFWTNKRIGLQNFTGSTWWSQNSSFRLIKNKKWFKMVSKDQVERSSCLVFKNFVIWFYSFKIKKNVIKFLLYIFANLLIFK
jgi:hypothetical protein